MKSTLIIQTGYAHQNMLEKGLNFDDMFKRVIGSENIKTIDVFKGAELPNDLSLVDRVILTGSRAMITERSDWMLKTEEWLRRVEKTEIPVLGVCFGHQMLTVAFGGQVDDHPLGTEVGTDLVTLSSIAKEDPIFSGLPDQIACYVSHTQSVIQKPLGSHVLGASDFEHHHILKIGERIYGLQFHPEFTDEINEDGINRSDKNHVKRLDEDTLKTMRIGLEVGEIILKRFMDL